MALNIAMKDGVCQITVEDEMTIFVAQDLKLELQAPIQDAAEIEVDLSQVTEIDAAGLQLMMAAKISAIAHGSQLRFVNLSEPVQALLKLSHLTSFFGDAIVLETVPA